MKQQELPLPSAYLSGETLYRGEPSRYFRVASGEYLVQGRIVLSSSKVAHCKVQLKDSFEFYGPITSFERIVDDLAIDMDCIEEEGRVEGRDVSEDVRHIDAIISGVLVIMQDIQTP